MKESETRLALPEVLALTLSLLELALRGWRGMNPLLARTLYTFFCVAEERRVRTPAGSYRNGVPVTLTRTFAALTFATQKCK